MEENRTNIPPVTGSEGRERGPVLRLINTLRFQVLGIVITSVLVPSFLGGWFASSRISDLLRLGVYTEIETRTQRLTEQLEDWLKARSSEVQAFTVSYLLIEDLKKLQVQSTADEKEESRKNIHSYLSYLLEGNIYFSGIAILGPDGSPIITQPAGHRQALDRIKHLPARNTGVREIQTEEGNILMLTQAMDLGRNMSPNYFVALMKIEHLRQEIMRLTTEGAVVYLVDSEGSIKAASTGSVETRKAPAGALALLQENEERTVYTGLQNTQVIATGARLDGLNWGLILETSKREALLPLTVFRRQIILMALGLAAIFLIPALLLARALVLPLEELSRVSRRIRSGKPGLQVQSGIGGELGEFISTFNSMSLSLKESLEEITSQSEELKVMTVTDPLTGRYNRRYIEDYLKRELDLAVRTKDPLTVLMIDLDHFKEYNDAYGHIAGDMVLKQLGELLVKTVRKTDVVARYGGEEWIICLSHTGKEGGRKIAEKIRSTVEEAVFILKDGETRITVSIGIATAPGDASDYSGIVEAADRAMYLAKTAGRNQIQVFTGPGSS